MRPAETIVWPGGEHSFRLGIGELRAIEQRSDAGVFVILMRLLGQAGKIDDVLGPIRLGLIGGGMQDRDAQLAIDAAMDIASPYQLAITAAEILRRFIMWEADDKPGEAPAGTATSLTRSPKEEPVGQNTTAPAPPSA